MTDPIADLLIRIKNAQAVGKPFVQVPFSNFKFSIVSLLEKRGLVGRTKIKGKGVKKVLEIQLRYKGEQPLIKKVKRISKPSRKVYFGWRDLSKFPSKGLVVLSTSSGLKTLTEAKKEKLGGEVLFHINP